MHPPAGEATSLFTCKIIQGGGFYKPDTSKLTLPLPHSSQNTLPSLTDHRAAGLVRREGGDRCRRAEPGPGLFLFHDTRYER